MSISRHIDDYIAEQGIVQIDEVVPDNDCQIFDGQVLRAEDRLEGVRAAVARILE